MLHDIPWAQSFWSARQRFADHLAVVSGGKTASHFELAQITAAIAGALLNAGARAPETVIVCLPNSIDAVAASYAVLVGSWCETPVNQSATSQERARFVHLSGSKFAICRRQDAPDYESLGCQTICPEELTPVPFNPDEYPKANPEHWSRFVFTSGSTGAPKAIVHSQAGRWSGALLQRAALPFMLRPGSCLLAMTPFTHGAALLTHAFLDGGAAVELHEGVDVDNVRTSLRSGRIDAMFAPPTVLAKIVASLEGETVTGLKTILTGTAPLPPNTYKAAKELFGPIVRITYGKSEIFNPITILDAEETDIALMRDADLTSNCVGWPEAGVEIQIVSDDGAACAEGEIGEVSIRAEHMSIGSYDGTFRPWPGTWHHTGDIGYFDARGRLHLVGRRADAIKSGGYKLYPAEIEQALLGAPGLPPIAIVGFPSDYWGEIVVAVAEANDRQWRSIAGRACDELARHKRPRLFVEVPQLPRNAQHKILRSRVLDILKARFDLRDGSYPEMIAKANVDISQ